MLSKFLTDEAPGKVAGLIAASLFSLAFLFAVSASDAGFRGTSASLPNVFSPEKVVAVADTAVGFYSNFLTVNFIQPLVGDYRIYGENLAWLSRQSGLTNFFGLEGTAQTSLAYQPAIAAGQGQVAGAQKFKSSGGGLSVDDLYSVLIW
ncbi:MAG: hypothetical protein COT92_00120 [Candidatus Doudnabacteria bacterium CG10_big_fil_rev_8_21_14_0_10_42_18]|uniref:Uncharacterized protein n=1 Tax=Candidatus Doudnabacteria bacterium CG10_big_fil_rev_8_21_14_0_10_42_18 TaxID=1974552 RepID=A0A2H0VBY8_9BACT|nr:MAG: hypothetical protein COT92_00120 [Candidatus Doudnabacteria bacterium CG10_big_fil_rev_8_21_14_0_10_42_18]